MSNHTGLEDANHVPCRGPLALEPRWHAPVTHLAGQPNTCSPDGRATCFTRTPGAGRFHGARP